MISVIARRECFALYATPLGWGALAAMQLPLAWLLFAQLDIYQKIQAQLRASNSLLGVGDLVLTPLFFANALGLLLLVPLLSMRGFADEIRQGRMPLLLSAPIATWQLVIGKWLGLFLATLPLTGLGPIMGFWLSFGTNLDPGRLIAAWFGLVFLDALIISLTLWFSASTAQAPSAVALSWALLFLLWLFDANGAGSLQALSLKAHLGAFFDGWLRTQDIGYFLAIGVTTLAWTIHRIWRLRGGQ